MNSTYAQPPLPAMPYSIVRGVTPAPKPAKFLPEDFSNEQRLLRARTFMETNFHRNLLLDEIAAEACLSKHHFKRLFKKRFGITPHQQLTNTRITQAKSLLLDASLSVNDITVAVGFEDTSSFIRLFKTRTGITPVNYRKLAIQKLYE